MALLQERFHVCSGWVVRASLKELETKYEDVTSLCFPRQNEANCLMFRFQWPFLTWALPHTSHEAMRSAASLQQE